MNYLGKTGNKDGAHVCLLGTHEPTNMACKRLKAHTNRWTLADVETHECRGLMLGGMVLGHALDSTTPGQALKDLCMQALWMGTAQHDKWEKAAMHPSPGILMTRRP